MKVIIHHLWLAPVVFTLLLTGCLNEEKASEVSMIELRMKEDGRYYLKGQPSPYSGIGFHEKNGQRISQSIFAGGFRHGNHVAFWPDTGKVRSDGNYLEGFREGFQTEWNEAGIKTLESNYSAGTLEGPYRTWYPKTGAIKEEGNYHAGKRQGTWTSYFDDSGLTHQDADNRRKMVELNYDNGELNGMKRSWTINGVLIYEGNFANGQMDGLHESWFPFGVKKDSTSYKSGRISGSYQEWHENGQLKYDAIYAEDGSKTSERFWNEAGTELKQYPVGEDVDVPQQ